MLKVLLLKVYNSSHCYFRSLASPVSSRSAKPDRYRQLKEKMITVLFLLLLGYIFHPFWSNIVFQISHRKKPRLLPGSWGCSQGLPMAATAAWQELCSRTTPSDLAKRRFLYLNASDPASLAGGFGFHGKSLEKRNEELCLAMLFGTDINQVVRRFLDLVFSLDLFTYCFCCPLIVIVPISGGLYRWDPNLCCCPIPDIL